MSFIRRISASISSSVDRAVSKVENHDAIVEAALKDTRQAAARARVRLERVRQDGNKLKSRHADLQLAASRWAERAKQVANDNESKALECLRRRRDCEAQAKNVAASIVKHDELEVRIADQVKKIETRVGDVSQQRNLMRSRQSVAEALGAINKIEGTSYGEVEDTFDRWEIKLGESEFLVDASVESDPLDNEFLAAEDMQDLRAELSDLLNEEDSS